MTHDNSHRRRVSFWRIIALLGLGGVLIFISGFQHFSTVFFNLRAAVFVGGATFFLLLGSYKNSFLKFIPDAFLTLFSEQSPDAEKAALCCLGAQYAAGSGVVGTLGFIIHMLASLNDPSAVSYGMATGLLPLLYGFLAALVFGYLRSVYSGGLPGETQGAENMMKNIAAGTMVLALIFSVAFVYTLSFSDHRFFRTPTADRERAREEPFVATTDMDAEEFLSSFETESTEKGVKVDSLKKKALEDNINTLHRKALEDLKQAMQKLESEKEWDEIMTISRGPVTLSEEKFYFKDFVDEEEQEILLRTLFQWPDITEEEQKRAGMLMIELFGTFLQEADEEIRAKWESLFEELSDEKTEIEED